MPKKKPTLKEQKHMERVVSKEKKMKINREWSMPSKNTFNILPIKKLIEKYLPISCSQGRWIDPFANDSVFKDRLITNDINANFKTDYNLDALDFLKKFDGNSVDGVLFDPPYSAHQIVKSYDGFGKIREFSRYAVEIKRIIKPDGFCISFGWNTNGMPYEMKMNGKKIKTGFKKEKEEILIVAHGGCHNDTLVVVDKKTNQINENQLSIFNA